MALVDKVFVGGVWIDSRVKRTNMSGTPVTSVAESGTGEMIPDEYALTLSAVAGGTATVTVASSSPNNPYNGKVVTGVPLDGVTAVTNVVPGVAIIFSATGANGNTADVFAGQFLGIFDASGVEAGVPSDGVRHQVVNTGTAPVSDAKAMLLTQAVLVKKTGTVFSWIKSFADDAVEKTVGGGSDRVMPYALKTIAVSGVGVAKVATLQVDGVTLGAASILDLNTGTEVSGTGLKAISGQSYRILTGNLEGLEFAISPECATNDIANVLVFNSRFIQIAPDEDGSEGAYGTVDVPLTQEGVSAGVIEPSGEAYYWVRVLVPLSGNSESNPHPINVALQASESGEAGWLV